MAVVWHAIRAGVVIRSNEGLANSHVCCKPATMDGTAVRCWLDAPLCRSPSQASDARRSN
jgi:hypothetical protein